jgi:hypothetical protein
MKILITEQQYDSFMKRRIDKVIFRKIVNPKVQIIVHKYPNGEIVGVDNQYGIRFPYKKGQLLNMGRETWASVNGYEISYDNGNTFKDLSKTKEKKFGIPVDLLPPHLKNL